MNSRVTVSAPASSANLGAGYDVFALALRTPFDVLTLHRIPRGIRTTYDGLPVEISGGRDVVLGVAKAMLNQEKVSQGVSIQVLKKVPVGAGLGSSAASSAAAVVGINELFELGLDKEKLVEYAGIGERIASGTAHYDNVAAAIAGGFVVVSGPHGFVSMKAPPGLTLCLVTPKVHLPSQKTRYARSLVPKHLKMGEVVGAVASASIMVHGFSTRSLAEIGKAMSGGFIDSHRSAMVPGFASVRSSAMGAGAAGVCISGAGPTVLAASARGNAKAVLASMIDAFARGGVQSDGFITRPGEGAKAVRDA